MTNKAKTPDELAEVAEEFAEIEEWMDVSVDTDIASQQRSNREAQMHGWNEDQARKIASEQGIELIDAHLQVVLLLRDNYLEYGMPANGRMHGDMLDEAFASQGGRKYLRRLFPEGPVTQGMRIADLPVPPHSVNKGLGTAR